jgi:hypothetical protein
MEPSLLEFFLKKGTFLSASLVEEMMLSGIWFEHDLRGESLSEANSSDFSLCASIFNSIELPTSYFGLAFGLLAKNSGDKAYLIIDS